MTLEKDIRSAVKEKKIIIGSRGVLRAARTGKLSGIIYAKNTPASTYSLAPFPSITRRHIHQPRTANSMHKVCGFA